MDAYRISYKILASDTDLYRRLRISRLLTLLQEAAIAHTQALGAGREKTLDRGLLWVLTVQQVKIERLPVYDESVVLESLPGAMQHSFYPRAYRMCTQSGEPLLEAGALWMLMDAHTRTAVQPEGSGVTIEGAACLWGSFFPLPPKLAKDAQTRDFTVPFSYVDLNGHMNNTRYFELAEDLMPDALRSRELTEIRMEFTGEAKLGERILLSYGEQDGEFLLSGSLEKRLFRIGMRYKNGL